MTRLITRFGELKVDAFLVSALPNIRYLTGFTGSNALLLLTGAGATLFTDPRYAIQASAEVACSVTISRGPLVVAVLASIKRKKLKRIGFEKGRVLFETYASLREGLPLGASLKPLPALIEELRMIKSDDEIARIRLSVETNSEAFARTVKLIRPGITEMDVAAEIEYQMRLLGADKASFETIVACGVRTALPHAHPTRQVLAANQLLLIDMGASRDGYASDMTRMLFLGKPAPNVRRMYDAVLDAQLAGIAAVREGVTAGQVDRRVRLRLKAEGLDKAFVHSTGHGLGLEIHEPPRIGKKDKTVLAAGMAITIEPGVYIEGTGGIRIEDTVIVTKAGCEVLTPTSKELMLL